MAALLFLAISTLLGGWISRRIECVRGFAEKTGIAMVIALVLQLWLPFLTSKLIGIQFGPLLAFILSLIGLVLLFWKSKESIPKLPKLSPTPAIFLSIVIGFLGWLFYTHSLATTADGWSSAGVAWEDQSYHAMLASSFLYSDNLRTLNYPHFTGWPLGYPFLADLVAATFVRLGATLGQAFWWSAWYAAATFIVLLWSLAKKWTGKNSLANLSIFLFLCAGGFGVVDFIREFPELGWPEVLTRHDYTNGWELALHYHNSLTGVLLPMRTSLFGMPIALAVILLTIRLLEAKSAPRRDWLLTGILFGLLPLVHAHSFLVVTLYISVICLVYWKQIDWRKIGCAATPIFLLAIPQLLWTRSQMVISDPPFIRFFPGWICEAKTFGDWLLYWLHNGGVFLPLGILSWFLAPATLKKQTAPLIVWLPLGNLVAFQPSPYDNIKFFAFANIAFAILIALTLGRLWSKKFLAQGLAVFLAIGCSASAFLSIWRETRLESLIVSWEGIAFAETVRANTPPRAVFLTSSELTHPVPVLTGRPLVLGYTGWLAQHGVPIGSRIDDVKAMFSGSKNALELLQKYHVTHVVIGPSERREFPDLNEKFFQDHAKLTITSGSYTLYELRQD